jgi:TatD DNase family protein
MGRRGRRPYPTVQCLFLTKVSLSKPLSRPLARRVEFLKGFDKELPTKVPTKAATRPKVELQIGKGRFRLRRMAVFYDTHAHLDCPDFAEELPQVVARASAAGITKIISIGTDLASSKRAVSLAAQFPAVFAVVGWHPSEAMQAPQDLRPALRELARQPKVVALGETGLDYHRLPSQKPGSGPTDDETYKRRQAELFRQHLEVATELGLNCVIHQRDCFEETLNALAPFAGRVRGVFHCFANDAAAMRRVLAMNSLVSFTGILTFKNGQNIRDTLAAAPLGQFMLETDSPFLAPVPYRGKRCEPAYVKEISETAATVKDCSLEELSEATCATAGGFFCGLMD